jgi:exonuclease III
VAVSGADVVGLSEVWADAVKDTIAAALKSTYPHSFYHPNDETFALGSGLLLLSKHPLTDCTYTRYAGLVNNDRFAAKGFYTARVNVATPAGQAPLWVALTHTQAGSSPEEVQVRAGHVQDLAQAIGRLPYGGSRVVLLGDMNICAEVNGQETAEYQQLKRFMERSGLRDVCRAVHPSAAADPMYTYDYFTNKLAKHFAPNEKVAQRLDYVFASGPGAGPAAHVAFSTPTDWMYKNPSGAVTDLSDHYPLLVAFGEG